jgi:Spy/CpxP family protein refolding chaperone
MHDKDEPTNATQKAPRRFRRGWIIAATIFGTAVLLAGGAALVEAKSGGWHHWHGDMGNEEFADHIELRVRYALKDVDATDEQKAQITTILQAAASDVHALAGAHESTHRQLHDIFLADTIDRDRLEAVRVEGLGLADQASKRVLQAVADAAQVLTPEQRAKLAAKMEERHH